jgi:rRNA maturation protein Nop10
MSMGNNDIEIADNNCPKCGSQTYRRNCDCEEGFSHHDCGEDSCCCLAPEPNRRCSECGGKGWHNWCPTCGWDLLMNRYINGYDEREL